MAQKKLTITVSEDVYKGLYAVVGKRNISRFVNELVRPYVLQKSLEDGYREMAADLEHEKEALEWSEGLLRYFDDEDDKNG